MKATGPLLNTTARTARSSAIRALLEQARRPGMISLAGGIPDPAGFPTRELAAIAGDALARPDGSALQYGLTAGELDLRQVVGTRHGDVEPGEVMITTGSQQGLDLLARILLDPGDVVVCAAVDYLGALQAFRSHGARLQPVPIDAEGLRVDVLEQLLLDGVRPKAVYVVPNFHNPTGSSLGLLRRAALHRLAVAHDFVLIEDDPYRELAYEGLVSSPGAPAPNVVQLGSVSKMLAPGLRVGWMVGPRWLLEAAEIAKQAADLHTSTSSQAIVVAALQSEWFAAHLTGLRDHYAGKRDLFAAELTDHLGDRLTFERPAGGMFVWARIGEAVDDGVDTDRLLVAALAEGVAFVPGSAFAVGCDLGRHLRLSFATASGAQIVESVQRLGRSLDRVTRSPIEIQRL